MSTSSYATIQRTPEGGIICFDRSLDSPIEEVFASITDPARMADWWPPFAADITVDLRAGGKIIFAWPDIDFPTLEFTIIRLATLRLLEHTHTSPDSWMRWEVEATADRTRLRATYFIPDLDMAVERGDLAGMHHSLDRLAPALSGNPIGWDNDAFNDLCVAYSRRISADI